MARKKTAILISGRGSNMAALLEAAKSSSYPAEIKLVVSNNPAAEGLDIAKRHVVPTRVIDHHDHHNREDFEADLHRVLRGTGIELICLAGFMRLLTSTFVDQWRDRIINIHPSLLPAFKGLNTHERALECGVKIHGCTVHMVRARMDDGPIIGQAAVPVLADDTPASLAGRVLLAEHRIYPLALRLLAAGKARVVGGRVELTKAEERTDWLINPSGD